MLHNLLNQHIFAANNFAPTTSGHSHSFVIVNTTAAAITPTITLKGANPSAADYCVHDPATEYDLKETPANCGGGVAAVFTYTVPLADAIPPGASVIIAFPITDGIPPFVKVVATAGLGLLLVGSLRG